MSRSPSSLPLTGSIVSGRFIGRVAELAEIRELYARGARLVTVVGTAGVGKTRFAGEYARSGMSPDFCTCDLAEAIGHTGAVAAVATAIGVPASSDLGTIGRAIAARAEFLLVLDDLDRVSREAGACIEAWLDVAPRARFVATSRAPIGVAGEILIRLEPLDPPAEEERDATRSRATEAIELFVDRVRSVRHDYEPSGSELAAVAELVRRVGGLPLAIELVAARAVVAGPAKLLGRLQPSSPMLAHSRRRRGAARHATLDAAIAVSWDLLDPCERGALAQLSVFASTFDLESAEAILEPAAAGAAPAIDHVQTLVDRSLIRMFPPTRPTAPPRFGLYDAVRSFARDQLAPDQAQQAFTRHRVRMLVLCERLAQDAPAPTAVSHLMDAAAELPELFAIGERALAAAPDKSAVDDALAALVAIDALLHARDHKAARVRLLEHVLALANTHSADRRLHARALRSLGQLRMQSGELDSAVVCLERAAVLARGAGDHRTEYRSRLLLSMIAEQRGHPSEASRTARGILAQVQSIGDSAYEAVVRVYIGQLAIELGDLDDARAQLTLAVRLARGSGDRRGEANARTSLGGLERRLGRCEAREHYRAALELFRELGDTRLEASALGNLGLVHQEAGQFDDAQRCYAASLTTNRELGLPAAEAQSLLLLGSLAHEQNQLPEARAWLDRALARAEENSFQWCKAVCLASLAGVEASLGHVGPAEDALARASEIVDDLGVPALQAAVDVYRGHLLLGRAVVATDAAAARDFRSAAAARLEVASRGGADSPAQRSDVVRLACRILERTLAATAQPGPVLTVDPPALVMDDRGRWFEHGGARADLRRRRSLRAILQRLVAVTRLAPTRVVSVAELFEAGWPGARIDRGAAANRVYVAINELRRLGLRPLIVSDGSGYRLVPGLRIVSADHDRR